MERITHRGRTTAYRVSDRGGTGTPVLFVHGSGGTHAVWRGQFRLADDRPAVALDLSGHGTSEDVDADPGFEALSAYADDVVAVAEETGAAVLVGGSMGGAIVLQVALERDLDPEALVLAGTGARMPVMDDLIEWAASDFDRAVEFLLEPGSLFADPDEETREATAEVLRENGPDVLYRDLLTCHRFDVRGRLGEVDAPTLAVVGEGDRLTPPWYHDELADGIPDAALAVVEDAGHLAMLERPQAFNTALERFLDDLSE